MQLDEFLGGVYLIRNTANKKRYIGSSYSLDIRRGKHIDALRGGKHKNADLQRDFDKYGMGAFEFEILDARPCGKPGSRKDADREILNLESYYIAKMRPEYNVRELGTWHVGVCQKCEKELLVSDDNRLCKECNNLDWWIGSIIDYKDYALAQDGWDDDFREITKILDAHQGETRDKGTKIA